MPERQTIFARISSRSPRDILAATLTRQDGEAEKAPAEARADHLLAELQRHGYRVKRR